MTVAAARGRSTRGWTTQEGTVTTLKIVAVGAAAGVLANVTGYLITGRLFHPYQAKTPSTWRRSESWTHYQYAMAIRIAACIAIALVYVAVHDLAPGIGTSAPVRGTAFALILWAVTVVSGR